MFGSSLDNIVVIPITRFVASNWSPRRSMNISVMAPTMEAMQTTEDFALGHFRQVRGLKPGDENDFELFSNDSLKEALAKIAVVVGTGGLLISAIALLCAGVGFFPALQAARMRPVEALRTE